MRNVVVKHDMSVLWGVGLEFDVNAHSRYPLWFSKATLIGVRDWGPEVRHRWVPCASCMHEIFDDRVDPDVDFVVYNHQDVLAPVQDTEVVRANELGLKNGVVPRMTDAPNQEMVDVVRFLARGRCVLTTSYYGAYWATLLGRNVIVWPWSSMFSYMRHRPAIVNRGSWTGYVSDSRNYPDALMECRQANMAFRDEVRALVRSRDMMHETFVSS
jgi:hypothetical protein